MVVNSSNRPCLLTVQLDCSLCESLFVFADAIISTEVCRFGESDIQEEFRLVIIVLTADGVFHILGLQIHNWYIFAL